MIPTPSWTYSRNGPGSCNYANPPLLTHTCLTLLWTLLFLTFLTACPKSPTDDLQPPGGTEEAERRTSPSIKEATAEGNDTITHGHIVEVVTLWERGERDAAIDSLLAFERVSGGISDPLPSFGWSEDYFGRLAGESLLQAQQENLKATTAAGELGEGAIETIRSMTDAPPEKLTLMRARVHSFAQALRQPRYNLVFRMIGEAVEKKLQEAGG